MLKTESRSFSRSRELHVFTKKMNEAPDVSQNVQLTRVAPLGLQVQVCTC